MIIELLSQNPIYGIVFLLAIALAIGIHEAAHAWSADKLGDSTASDMGRSSINPLVHLDPIGSLLFLIAGFGWGKPVPVNENRLRGKYDVIKVALAGPASNLLTAIGLALVYRIIPNTELQDVLSLFIFVNLSLMTFNLIPIPPLDGSKLLRLFIPEETYEMLEQYSLYLILILFFLFQFGGSGIGGILLRVVSFFFTTLTGTPLSL